MIFEKDLIIQFDNPTKAYYPGQDITGKVIFICDKEKKVRGLKIKSNGRANVSWIEPTAFHMGPRRHREYCESITLFEYSYFAFGNDNSETIIPPGSHTYPFCLTLPSQLPSSFEDQLGFVKYEIKATLIKNSLLFYTATTPFLVTSLVDLNFNRSSTAPVRISKEISVFPWLWNRRQTGPVSFNLFIPKRGFVPGEYIPVKCEITNNSSRPVTDAELRLCQAVIYKAEGKKRTHKKILVRIKRGQGLGVGCDPETWNCDLIKIPQVVPTGLGYCRLIDVQYYLHVKIKISGSRNLKADAPIIIGNIPLRSQSIFQATPDFNGQITYADILQDLPSYEEAATESIVQKIFIEQNDRLSEVASAPEYNILPNYGWNLH